MYRASLPLFTVVTEEIKCLELKPMIRFLHRAGSYKLNGTRTRYVWLLGLLSENSGLYIPRSPGQGLANPNIRRALVLRKEERQKETVN